MKHGYHNVAIEELRKWNDELERLEERSRRIPPDKRIDIDTKTEDLRLKESFVARMVDGLKDAGQETAGKLAEKIEESISELAEEIRQISEKIRSLDDGT